MWCLTALLWPSSGNNTLLFPARSAGHWSAPEDLQGIVYFTDWESSQGGGTAIVPVRYGKTEIRSTALVRSVFHLTVMSFAGAFG